MGFLTVTLGANQHVSGLGLTIALIGLSEFANRLLLTGAESAPDRTADGAWNPLSGLGEVGVIAQQYGLTYVAFLVVAPAAWWLLGADTVRPGHPCRGREPGGGRCCRHQRGPDALRRPDDRLRADGRGRRVPDAGRARLVHPGHHRGAWLGVPRAGHLRPLGGLAGRAGRAHLRAGLFAGASAPDHGISGGSCRRS